MVCLTCFNLQKKISLATQGGEGPSWKCS